MTDKVVQEYRCTSCGGQMQFDPEAQALVCRDCGEQAEERVGAKKGGDEGECLAMATDGLTCPNCGAQMEKLTGANQTSCEFCGSTFSVFSEGEDCPILGEIPENHRYVIPFAVSEDEYKRKMISNLAAETAMPLDAFDKMAMIRSAEAYYIPHYLCIASYQVNWTASIGYDRIETYTVYENGKAVTRTRIVTDWRPGSGRASGRVGMSCAANAFPDDSLAKAEAANGEKRRKDVSSCSGGRRHVPAAFASSPGTMPQGVKEMDTKYTAGLEMLSCDIPAQNSYDKNFTHDQIRRAIERDAPGDRIRNLRFNGNIVPDYSLIYIPAWVSVYSYKDTVCINFADGTAAEGSHTGTRPVDRKIKRRARKFYIPGILSGILLIIAFIVGMTEADFETMAFIDEALPTLGIVTAALLILGFIGAKIFYGKKTKKLQKAAESYLANPSKLFGRKSAKPDPLRRE